MAPPGYYTEESLMEFAHGQLRSIAETIGWSVEAGSYTELVNDIMLELGVETLEELTGTSEVQTLRALARLKVLKGALRELAARYNYRSQFQGFDRKQMYDMAKEQYQDAINEAVGLGIDVASYSVIVSPVVFIHDPYAAVDEELQVYP